MNSIIEEIFFGKRGHTDTIIPSKEYMKTTDKLCETHEYFCNVLPEELKADFDKLCCIFDEREALAVLDNFKEGLKIGILLGVEASS